MILLRRNILIQGRSKIMILCLHFFKFDEKSNDNSLKNCFSVFLQSLAIFFFVSERKQMKKIFLTEKKIVDNLGVIYEKKI